jgi:hypothetical protein
VSAGVLPTPEMQVHPPADHPVPGEVQGTKGVLADGMLEVGGPARMIWLSRISTAPGRLATVIRNSTPRQQGGQIVPVPGEPARMRGMDLRTGKEACAGWRRRWRAGPEHRARLLAEWS